MRSNRDLHIIILGWRQFLLSEIESDIYKGRRNGDFEGFEF